MVGIDFQEEGYKNRFECIFDQFKQFRKEKKYFKHYLANAFYALFNNSELFVDYRRLSHKNLIMDHGFGRLFKFTESLPIEDFRDSFDKKSDLEELV